jgi:CheY-like chemotaxis protein
MSVFRTSTPQVLIVDDDAEIRAALRAVLDAEGYRVDEADNGRAALDWLHAAEQLPSVIVLDLNMPVMNGWELRSRLRGDPRLARIPVVVASTLPARLAGVRARLAAEAFVDKPISVPDLLRVIRRLAGRRTP